MRTYFSALLLFSFVGLPATAQETVYLIRHAEKELSGSDPALTPAGRQRAADWADMLRNVGLDKIFTSDALRTRETGGIIATALDLPRSALPRRDIVGLIDTLEFDHAEDTILVVGHAETIPGILESLGASESLSIEKDEFDNLFILVRPASAESALIHLRMP